GGPRRGGSSSSRAGSTFVTPVGTGRPATLAAGARDPMSAAGGTRRSAAGRTGRSGAAGLVDERRHLGDRGFEVVVDDEAGPQLDAARPLGGRRLDPFDHLVV